MHSPIKELRIDRILWGGIRIDDHWALRKSRMLFTLCVTVTTHESRQLKAAFRLFFSFVRKQMTTRVWSGCGAHTHARGFN